MPRYCYKCKKCEVTHTIEHSADESLEACPVCGVATGFSKLLTSFRTNPPRTAAPQVGEVTENFIKDARIELQQQKKELKDKT